MSKVEIYTKGYCPYCHRAKSLLKSKGTQFTEISIDNKPKLREHMISRANGGYTVPQIFIDGKHIGGCDDLVALDNNNGLDALLQA